MRRVARWCGVLSVVALALLLGAELVIRVRAAGRAGTSPGAAAAATSSGNSNDFDSSDSFADGTPDYLRLHAFSDRQAFRNWFTLIAESQYYRRDHLPREISDCAALVRFSYREALRRHDAAWLSMMQLPAPLATGEVRQYQYPFTPLRAASFRIRDGEFHPGDVADGAFAEFADAKTLWRYNTHFVARELNVARGGDLLLFRQEGHDLPFHAMIFLGHSQVQYGAEQYVVYHTGPEGKWPGEVRRLAVKELLNYPDARWRPASSNPAFLGVYRWNILRGDD